MLDESTIAKFEHQAAMLANRVKKRFKHLYKRFARQNIDVFRLYDGDIPEIRAAVDWYAGHLVIAEYMRRQSVPEWLPMMGAAWQGRWMSPGQGPSEKRHGPESRRENATSDWPAPTSDWR
jgi:23S rRNA (cytosine1962-C5)-methyltransferase